MESLFPNDFLLEKYIQGLMLNLIPPPRPIGVKPIIKKSLKTSAVYCDKGEKALAKNQNNEALKAFTDALVMAPGSSKKIVDCYIGRSIALQKLKAYPESLRDIERALQLEVTEEQMKNLLKRKLVMECLLTSANFQKLKVNASLEEQIKLSYGENKKIPGVSSAVTLVYNKKFGRHYIATRDIKVGDVLMIQKPFVFVPIREADGDLKSEKKQWICDNCLNATMDPIPCNRCTLSLYCSTACKSEAFRRFHKMECKIAEIEPPFETEFALYLRALMLATKQGEKFEEAINLMEEIKNCKDKRTAGFKDGILDGNSANAFFSLLTHMDKQNLPELILSAVLLTDALRKHTDFLRGNNDYNNVLRLGKLILYLSFICHMNVYGIRRRCASNKIALAIFPVFNLLNNSCECNTLWYDDEQSNKILRACKNIGKDEQIFVSYLTSDVLRLTAEERRNFFEKYKFFTCQCEACKGNYTYKPELKRAFKVPSQLKRELIKKPNDTESLWELLKLVLNVYNGPSLEAKTIQLALVNAHMGSENADFCQKLRNLRIL